MGFRRSRNGFAAHASCAARAAFKIELRSEESEGIEIPVKKEGKYGDRCIIMRRAFVSRNIVGQ